ncbi:MAG: TIGR03663 family protein [Lentisphaerales bacterium]|nr:TIGR03663 family protein [Lentisphaerales bacterium]
MNLSSSSKYFITGFLFLLIIGGWLRLRNINERPMHGDEANQAYQFQLLWEDGTYKYEPRDFHGPTLYFMTLPWMKITGAESFESSEKLHFRSLPMAFAFLTALCSLLMLDLLTRKGALALTGMLMLSPSMIYYNSYYIQESLLVFSVTLFIALLWRFYKSGRLYWLAVAGGSLGFMHATKETFVISIFAIIMAGVFTWRKQLISLNTKLSGKGVAVFLGSAIFVSVIFYSSFFTHAQGPIDSVTSMTNHIGRGLGITEFPDHLTSGQGHTKSSFYYIQNIIGHFPRKLTSTVKDIISNNAARPITEFLFFALWLGALFFIKKNKGRLAHVHKFFFWKTFFLLLVYSLIPYKTPWCAQVIIYSMIATASLTLIRSLGTGKPAVKWAVVILSLVLFIDMGRQGILITEQGFSVSDRNQYAYSHSVLDVESLASRIEDISQVSEQGYEMPIHFFTSEYWPMPWYLKKFKKIGYWENKESQFSLSGVPVIVTTPDRTDIISQIEKSHQSELRSRLPGYWLQVFYREDLWQKFMESKDKN